MNLSPTQGLVLVNHCRNALSVWWPRAELNHRHTDFQSAALPTELLGQVFDFTRSGRVVVAPAHSGRQATAPSPETASTRACAGARTRPPAVRSRARGPGA